MPKGQSRWYDVTLHGEYTKEQIINYCKAYCKKWAFQKERGAQTGYEHYQCKFFYPEAISLQTVAQSLIASNLNKAHIERSFNLSFNYATKIETRIEGPWSSEDQPIPKWLSSENPQWYPWQEKLISETADERTVRVIIDPIGNTGKSFLSNWFAVRKKATIIPLIGNYKDVMRAVSDRPKTEWYIIDVPRAEKLNEHMIAAIEEIKNGHVWDDRYKFEETWFEPPKVTIFTNKDIPFETLSKDRWKRCHIKRTPRGWDTPDF